MFMFQNYFKFNCYLLKYVFNIDFTEYSCVPIVILLVHPIAD